MPTYADGGNATTRTPAPEGTHQAVCVDVIDLGKVPNKFKDGALQHKINLAWQINELRDDGKRFLVYKRYTLSLHEKATLRKDLESWRGKPFEESELPFDIERLIGANCLLNVIHNGNFANVSSVMAPMKGMPKLEAQDYVRKAKEEDFDQTAAEAQVEVDEIPFAWVMPLILPLVGVSAAAMAAMTVWT